MGNRAIGADHVDKCSLLACSTQPVAQPAPRDPVQVDPSHYTVELENDRVRVLRIKCGPGEKSAMHGHPRTIAVFLSPANFRFTYPGGKTEDGSAKAGEVMYFDPFEHLPENTGNQSFELIAIELKGGPAPASNCCCQE